MRRALLLSGAGAALIFEGVARIYLPAALILAGLALCALGLLAVDVDRKRRA